MNQQPGTEYTRSDIIRLKMIAGMCEGSILDIGCGSGKIRDYLPISCDYTGIDVAPSGYGTYGNVYSDTSKKYQTVLLLEVLEHLEYPLLALSRIYSTLEDSGKLIISVPNPYNLDQIASVLHNNTDIRNQNHIAMFGDNEIRSLCFHAGFSSVHPIRFYTKVPGLNWLSPIRSRFGEWSIYEVRP